MGDDSGLDLGGRSRDGTWLDPEYILKVEPIGLADRLDMCHTRKRGVIHD